MAAPMASTHKIQINLSMRPPCSSFAAGQAHRLTTSPNLRTRMVIQSATEGSVDPQDPTTTNSDSNSSNSSPPPRIVTTPPAGRSFPPPPPSAMQPDLKFQKVETLGTDSIAGVAAVERTSKDFETPTSLTKAIKLAAGDTLALLIFATIGRVSHHEALTLASSFETALPFFIGWFATAPFLGGFGKDAQGGDVGAAVGAAAKSWIVAVPVSILIRSLLRGYVPDKAFIIVSFVATAVLLFSLRAAQAAVTPESKDCSSSGSRRNKRGNPLEFFSLLASLTKRW
jgi:Protein of unknown function (DUF3054)